MMTWTKHLAVPVGFSLLLVAAVPAAAGPLDPTAFAPVGSLPTAAGTYYFNTSTLTLNAPGPFGPLGPPGPTLLTGVDYNGIAVFDFSSITVNSDQMFVGTGTLPLALLSRSDINVNGTIDASAPPPPGLSLPSSGGPGGFGSGVGINSGPGAGQGGAEIPATGAFSSAGGGGFGGSGGNGGRVALAPAPTYLQVIPFGGGRGGSSYGDLAVSLQGGSGGGSYSSRAGFPSGVAAAVRLRSAQSVGSQSVAASWRTAAAAAAARQAAAAAAASFYTAIQ
ncbi:MAG: hypothetical protein JO114_01115 [Planctomycetaceae bacterium]|nr:hypothetical protein [Planctomycetaceae bacterium]